VKDVIVDASVAIKWAAPEELSDEALFVLARARLAAPDLLIAECGNILWKKVQRGQMDADTAELAAKAIMRAEIELMPMRPHLAAATALAIKLAHPVYDCLYLALALERECRFVTADLSLAAKIAQSKDPRFAALVLPLKDAPVALTQEAP
jgi:predicted nucleic acid-binding protein